MKLTTMFRDLFKSLFSKPATKPFPNPHPDEPERLRGRLHWNPANCTGCQLCVKDCPSDALKLFIVDKAKKQFVLSYDAGRCTFCAQCVENCRFNCLSLSNREWAISDTSKEPFKVLYGEEENVQQWLAGSSPSDADTSE